MSLPIRFAQHTHRLNPFTVYAWKLQRQIKRVTQALNVNSSAVSSNAQGSMSCYEYSRSINANFTQSCVLCMHNTASGSFYRKQLVNVYGSSHLRGSLNQKMPVVSLVSPAFEERSCSVQDFWRSYGLISPNNPTQQGKCFHQIQICGFSNLSNTLLHVFAYTCFTVRGFLNSIFTLVLLPTSSLVVMPNCKLYEAAFVRAESITKLIFGI